MQFLRIKKEVFRLRGELQNDSISGVSSDEKRKVEDDINREVRRICDMNPPFLHDQLHIKMRNSVSLVSGTTATLTGTKGLPIVNDSASNLTKKHIGWMLSEGTHRYRIIGVTGTTIKLNYGTFTTATTANTWVAYKDVYPLPHNCGRIMEVWYEDGDRRLRPKSGAAFLQDHKRLSFGSNSTFYSQDAYTNRWGKYKFLQTGVTATQGSIVLSVGTTYAAYYDVGDVLKLDTATTDEHIHTISGVDSTSVYLDREYSGATGQVDIQDNPVTHTDYISFWHIPTTEKDVVLDVYLRTQDMVADTDECILPDRMCWVLVYGALRQDAISRGFLTEQQIAMYDSWLQEIKRSPYSGLVSDKQQYTPLGGSFTFRSNDISS